jgi:hypothetical protein
MHSREYILAGMHSLECILKIEDPNAALLKGGTLYFTQLKITINNIS